MPLENLTGSNVFITNLVPSNPAGTDPVSEGDEHIKGTKNVLLNSWPNINGAVTATPEQLNQTVTLDTVYAKLDSPAFVGTPTAPTALSGVNTTQLATTAFVQSAINSGSSVAASGYQKFPSGLIMQWGTAAMPAGNNGVDVTFPIPFPTAAFVALVTANNGSSDANGPTLGFRNLTTSGMRINNGTTENGSASNYFVIGH